ncbi:DUF1963 domain-containing protein [Fuerstiella marisgermanici]|uniref:DUF1963 domain-containing protein n=1 Tax=Fuerstiella marisgermanici TaxID=1891926 RepID=A0A1P8WCY7_9PLAN|nr:hypothetical protein Fuma_01521 [Fuerstiella marisgermanici]
MTQDTLHIGDISPTDELTVLSRDDLASYSLSTNWPTYQHVMGPGDILARSRQLEEYAPQLTQCQPRPTLCFVFGVGEDGDRAATRLGGLPFWPSSQQWPTAQNGAAKQFIGQFDFRSVRWPEPLPGDVLTVHFDYDWDGDGRFNGAAHGAAATLTWHDSSCTDLLSRTDLPPPNEWYAAPGPFYSRPVLQTDYKTEWSEHAQAFTVHGMKIGGHSPFFRANWTELTSAIPEPVFLCSIGYVSPDIQAEEPDAWLKSRVRDPNTEVGDAMFPGAGVLAIAYEKGNPSNLYWIAYSP